MTKKEIFDAEQENYTTVVCHKEGAFWVAYERSAYLFCKRVRPFKPSKKFIKAVGEEMVSIGFPDQAWAQLAPMIKVAEKAEKRIVLDVAPKEATYEEFKHRFEAWKDGLDATTAGKRAKPHENLPVYKAVYDLTLKIFRQSQHMSKDYRYTLGEKLKNEAIELLIDIYSANTLEDKEPFIADARRRIELIRVILRVCGDLGQFAIKNLAALNLDMEEIIKQLAAWHAATLKRQAQTI